MIIAVEAPVAARENLETFGHSTYQSHIPKVSENVPDEEKEYVFGQHNRRLRVSGLPKDLQADYDSFMQSSTFTITRCTKLKS